MLLVNGATNANITTKPWGKWIEIMKEISLVYVSRGW